MEIKRLKIRKVEEADRATYTELVHEFYHSEAVIAPVPACAAWQSVCFAVPEAIN